MKKNNIIMFLLLLGSTCILVSAPGAVSWHGSHTPDVVDCDLVMEGEAVKLGHHTKISAIDRDICVFLQEDAQLLGESNSTLYVEAVCDRTITFNLTSNLVLNDLTVIQHGAGTVQFIYADGVKLVLRQGSHNKGTQWWIVMNDSETSIPTLSFGRACGDQSNNNFVVIREKSLISFVGDENNTLEQGLINFDPTNEGTGRFVLQIENKGAFLIKAATTSQSNPCKITAHDIDPTTPAAGTPMLSIINSDTVRSDDVTVSSSLLVLNYNETLFDLLIDPFYNLNTRDPLTNYVGDFDGIQYGFVLGVASETFIEDDSYLDYVALANNQDPKVHTPGASPDTMREMIKQRNPSALLIDGSWNPEFADAPATIFFGNLAALELRSGVAKDGTIAGLDADLPFTVLPEDVSDGAGNWVLDVEGPLVVEGLSAGSNKIEVLSLFVEPTGGSLLTTVPDPFIFTLRTFVIDPISQAFAQYNKGVIYVNNTMNLEFVTLEHTDMIHTVLPNNDICSEPTYVGGETFKLSPLVDEYGFEDEFQELIADPTTRPQILFENSSFNIHTSAAATGVDFVVPNIVVDGISADNLSSFVFYNNGIAVDNGSGRNLILGTIPGSLAIDNKTIIDRDSYVDVVQLYDFSVSNGTLQELILLTAPNTTQIVPVVSDTTTQSIQTIFLGGDSNIGIGTDADSTGFINNTSPLFFVDDNYFSFDAPGNVAMSGVTGKRGIFVDLNGTFSLSPDIITSFGVTITRSRNGQIDLLKNQAFFKALTGISTWNVNLGNQNILVGPAERLSEYTFNWMDATKDYTVFMPYVISDILLCAAPVVTPANVTDLPTILGTPEAPTTVDQLQIQGSRIGDPAMIMFDGCLVREVIFNPGRCPAEAPVALFVLQNDAVVGIGSADQNVVSNNATVMLGVNGVEIIANGNGTIVVNQDILINNVFSILKGPDYVEGDKLTFYSAVPKEIRVKPTAVFDIRSFSDSTDLIEIAGEVRIVFEPGSMILMDGATLQFTDTTQMIFEASPSVYTDISSIPFGPIDNTLSPAAVVDASDPHNQLAALTGFGFGLQNTNPYRVRIIGIGTIGFDGEAFGFLPNGAFLGIETLLAGDCEIDTTSINLLIEQSGAFHIGRLDPREGGVFQIGNVLDNGQTHNVSFTLTLNGPDAVFELGALGMLGIGMGSVRPALLNNAVSIVPQFSLINNLFNVQQVTIDCIAGNLDISRIYASDDPRSSTLAISDDPAITYTLLYAMPEGDDEASLRLEGFATYGGSNLVKVEQGEVIIPGQETPAIAPVVETTDGQTEQPRLEVGMIASTLLQDVEPEITGDATVFFEQMKTDDATQTDHNNQFGRANVAEGEQNFRIEGTADRAGTVIGDTIVRTDVYDVSGQLDSEANREQAIQDGAGFALVDQLQAEIIAMGIIPVD